MEVQRSIEGLKGTSHGPHDLSTALRIDSLIAHQFSTPLRDRSRVFSKRIWALIKTQSVFIKAQILPPWWAEPGPRAEHWQAVRRRQCAVEGWCNPWPAPPFDYVANWLA